jgi:hypothetical protein
MFGMTVRSYYALPYAEVAPVEQPDVAIEIGSVPKALKNRKMSHGVWQAGPMAFLLNLENIGRILVTDGSRIVVEPIEGADPRMIGVYINGSALAALLQQRGLLPLHASAVKTPVGAVLFAGASGAGKSTLASTLNDRGYTCLTDDVSAVSINDGGEAVIHPAYGHLRLWQDATEKLGYDTVQRTKAASGFPKFEFPIAPAGHAPVRIDRVYFVEPHWDGDLVIQAQDQREALNGIFERSYRRNFHPGQGLQAQHFSLATALKSAVKTYRVLRPKSECPPRMVADLIEQHFLSEAKTSLNNGE